MRPFHRLLLRVTLLLALAAAGRSACAADLKIATVAPEGSQWMSDLRAAATAIREQTAGRVNLKLYGGGVMGTDRQVMRKIRIGQLHGSVFTTAALAEIAPDTALYGLPLVFNSQEEVDFVRSRMDGRLQAALAEKGFASFGFVGGGFAQFLSREPVRGLADLRGRKVWVPEGDRISALAMEALGLAPVSLPIADVLTSLQTGLLDVVAGPPAGALTLQWHTRTRYTTDLPLAYTLAAVVIDRKPFDAIAAADRDAVTATLTRAMAAMDRRSRQDNERAAAAMAGAGLVVVAPAEGAVPEWRDAVTAAQPRMVQEGLVSAAGVAALRKNLDEFRSRN